MGNLDLTIRNKIVYGVCIAVLATAIIIGFLARNTAHNVVEDRLRNKELPAMMYQHRYDLERLVWQLDGLAEEMATSPFVLDLISQDSLSAEDDKRLVDYLNNIKHQYQLDDVSVANKQTAKYWNQDGFLRVLTQEQDGWFFGLISGNKAHSLNLFTYPDGKSVLFINYQQLDSFGLAGLSMNVNEWKEMLSELKVEQTGLFFLADAAGTVKLHQDNKLIDKQSISGLYGEASRELLAKNDFNLVEAEINGETLMLASSYIPKMDWYLVMQVPKSEVFAQLVRADTYIILSSLFVAVLFIVAAIIVSRKIIAPIEKLADTFLELGEGEGDLSQRIDIKGNDEIARLSRGFNSFVEKIHMSMQNLSNTGNELKQAAEGVANKADATLQNSIQQRDKTLEVVTAINQMGATIAEIAENAAMGAESAKSVENDTASGQIVVNQAKDVINQLASDMENVSRVINNLANNTQEIGTILDVIRGISEQTNLLALNAAIEAARAGEQGRGFSVVADEVRNLASRTADSTDEIQKMINKLQSEASAAVSAMDAGQALTAKGVTSSDEATTALMGISGGITSISDMNTQVATATEEQSTVVKNINENIEEINIINQQTSDTSEELSEASQKLNDLSRQMDELVGTFKL